MAHLNLTINQKRDEEMLVNQRSITRIANVDALFNIIVLMFTLITLVLAVVLRESPQH